MRPDRTRKVLVRWDRKAKMGAVRKGGCHGPSGLLTWYWQSRCEYACTLLLVS